MAVYSQLISSYVDGETITASLFNNEFNQIVASFDKALGHNHDGVTDGSGAPISSLYANAITLGTGQDTDISLTFNANTSDGVLTWMEDESKFTFDSSIDVTGTVTADLVKLNPTGGANEGGQIEFERAVDNQTAWYVDVNGSGTDTSLRFVDNDDTNNPVTRVSMNNTGIDVTGTVKGDSLTIDNGSGLTDAYIASATGKALLTVKSTHDGEVSEEVAGIEVGAKSLSYLDLKIPDDDDYDLRIAHSEANGSLINSLVDDLVLRSGAKVALQHAGANTKLETTATGINVTGDVAATTVTVGDSTGTNLELYEDSSQNAIIRQRGTGSLQISGINGSLSNDDYEQLLTWGSDAIHLSWQGSTGAGTKLSTTATGIDVTGTVDLDNLTIATAQGTAGQVLKSTGSGIEWGANSDTLAQALALGNTTGGTDIDISGGSNITSSQSGGFTIESDQGLSLHSNAGFGAGIGSNFSVFNVGSALFPAGTVAIIPTVSRNSGNPAVVFNYTDAIFYDNIRLGSSNVFILSDDDIKLKPAAAKETVLQSSGGAHRVQSTETHVGLYYGATAAQTAVKLQTSATGVDVTGTVSITSPDPTLILKDSSDSDDHEILFRGSDDVDNLKITSTGDHLNFITADSNKKILMQPNGATALEVNTTGIDVTGTVTADGVSLANDQRLICGSEAGNNYLEIFESTTGTGVVKQVGAGNIAIQGQGGYLQNDAGNALVAWDGNHSELSWQGATGAGVKLATTETGMSVTGVIDCDTSLQIRSSATADDDAMPDIYLDNQHSPAAEQRLGMIAFRGFNDAATAEMTSYGNIYTSQEVITDGAEEGKVVLQARNGAGYVNALEATKGGITVGGQITLPSSTSDSCFIGTTVTETATHLDFKLRDDDADSFRFRFDHYEDGVSDYVTAARIKPDPDIAGSDKYLLDVTGKVVAEGFSGTGASANIITHFSTDAAFSSSTDSIVPTALAVKTYVDNAAFPATTNNAADIAYTAFNTFSGKRIINTASATNTTYGLPTPVAADVGKSWVICNPTDSEITIDHDASGTANYVWIMDGVTLSAAASSWTIKKGAIVEIVVVASDSGGGSATAPNYLIFGAGLLEIV